MSKEIINNNKELKTPIEIMLQVNDNGETTARKLYEFLELNRSNYAKWTKRNIVDNQFAEENVDFWAFVLNDEWGGQATTDYRLTASFAKKLAMGTNNERGEQAKNYFIKVEDELKKQVTKNNIPQTKLEWIQFALEQEQQIIEKENLIKLQKPKVEIADKFFSSDDNLDMNRVAKIINERITNKKKIGQNTLFKILRQEKVLQTDTFVGWNGKRLSGKHHNIPYQQYIDKDYFTLKPYQFQDQNGDIHVKTKTLVTTNGVEFIWRFLNRKGYIENTNIAI